MNVRGIVARWLVTHQRQSGDARPEQLAAARHLLAALRELHDELARPDHHWRAALATLIVDVQVAMNVPDPPVAVATAGERFLGSAPSVVLEGEGAPDWYLEDPPQEQSPSSTGFAWFAHPPEGYLPPEEPPISVVRLEAVAHAGPFWDDDSCLGDDFEELHHWLGISRSLYDDVMAWDAEYQRNGHRSGRAHRVQRGELMRRLADEVKPGIEVR